jgi:hypothetical protein
MSPEAPRSPAPPAPDAQRFWRDLLHLWFVKYNPLYLVSAMLVLAGLNLVSKGLASDGSLYGPLAVGLVAEVYAAALIGGAALLTRVGQRRPAVLLALVAIVYQGDLTLHTETCSVLGLLGVGLSALWLAVFVAKLVALAWALRVRIGPRALLTAAVGAGGVAFLPYAFAGAGPEGAGTLLALFVLGLGVIFPRDLADCVSPRPGMDLDAWGRLVLRRTVLAAWGLWGLLLAFHVAFWAHETPIAVARVLPVLLALVLARQPREGRVWAIAGGALLLVAVARPTELSTVAALVAITLALRAFTRLRTTDTALAPVGDDPSPYRAGRTHEREGARVEVVEVLARVSAGERLRLLTGALAATYLAQATTGWEGGALPAHHLLVDGVFLAVAAAFAWRLRGRLVLVFAGAVVGHGLVAAGLVPRPHSLVGWGASALALGFLLLFGAIGVSYALPRRGVGARLEDAEPR